MHIPHKSQGIFLYGALLGSSLVFSNQIPRIFTGPLHVASLSPFAPALGIIFLPAPTLEHWVRRPFFTRSISSTASSILINKQ